MTPRLVLDSEALAALAGRDDRRGREVQAALTVALRHRREVVVPAVVLAELYRGRRHNAMVDATLSRETGVRVRETDRVFARLVGGVLAAADEGSDMMVDAHVVAAVAEVGGGVVMTSDPDDLDRLAAPYPSITVVDIS